MNPILSTQHLDVANGRSTLFRDLNCHFYPGQISVIVGENGVGKSTLLNHLAGIVTSKGSVWLGPQNISLLSPRERAKSIATLGQQDIASHDLLVESRIAQGLAPRRGFQALLDPNTSRIVHQLCDELAISHLLGRQLGNLSGGEKKRVQIARALIDDQASVYILDEPDAGLDIRHRETLLLALKRRRNQNKVVIATLHDLSLSRRFDRSIVLGHQSIVADGPSHDLLSPQIMERAFGVALDL